LKEYPETLEIADKIGLRIHRVAFKGYQVGEALQYTQDQMIRSRGELQLVEEREKHSQALLDMQLQKEQERMTKKQALEIEQTKNQIQLAEIQNKFDLSKLKEKHSIELEQLNGWYF